MRSKNLCRKLSLALSLVGGICFAVGLADAAPVKPPQFVTDELLVQFKAGVPGTTAAAALRGAGGQEAEELPQLRVKRIKVPAAAREKVKAALAKNPHISFVEENHLAEPLAIPNDPSYPSQWHLPKISAPAGWDITSGDSTIDIAILDSGVDPYHPDLSGKLIPGYNFYAGNTDTRDVHGHGTKVAGAAAAMGNNAVGIAGVAMKNSIMPLVIADSTAYATYSRMASAITWAADRGVRIINISYGGTSSSSTLQNAINYAWNKGAIVFASAANYNTSTPYYPAACDKVVSVAATDSADAKASFSNYGATIDVAAPGVSILTTVNGSGYGSVSGTSFAAPITAGLGALILSTNPLLTAPQVVDLITKNADDIGTPGFDQYFGHGRINVAKSLVAAQNTLALGDSIAPTAAVTSPGAGTTLKGTVSVGIAASDNIGVIRVDFKVDNAVVGSTATAPYVFAWDTSSVADGDHILTATAHDAAGNIGYANNVAVKVANTVIADTTAPTVVFSSPANGSRLGNKTTVKIATQDNVGVKKVELYINGKLQTSTTSAALSYIWNTRNVAKGTHTLTAKTYDAAGNVGTTTISVSK